MKPGSLDVLCAGKLVSLKGSFDPVQGELLHDAVAVFRLRLDPERAQELAPWLGKTLHLRITSGGREGTP